MQQAAGAYVAGLAYGALNARAGALGRKALLGGAVYLGSKVRKMVNKSRRKAGGLQRGRKRRSRYGTRGPMTKLMRTVMNAKRSAGAPLPRGSGKRRNFGPRRRKASRPVGSMDTYLQLPRQNIGRMARMTMKRLEKFTFATAIVRHQGVNRLNGVSATRDAAGFITSTTQPGFYSMLNGTGVGTPLPLHAMLLNTGLVGQAEGNLQQCSLTAQGNTSWSNLTCQTAVGGTVASTYQDEYQSTNIEPSRYIRYKWYDIRMCLYGAVTQPAIWDIWLVKFTQDELVPFGDVESNTSDNRTLANRSAFWQSLIKPATYHPMLPGVHMRKGWRVLKHKRVNIPGSSNDDLDVAPPSVQLRWFYRDGKTYDYHWNNNRLNDVQTEGPQWAPKISNSQVQFMPRPKAQVFLIIRCSNVISDADSLTNWNGVPTYDLVVRARRDHVH